MPEESTLSTDDQLLVGYSNFVYETRRKLDQKTGVSREAVSVQDLATSAVSTAAQHLYGNDMLPKVEQDQLDRCTVALVELLYGHDDKAMKRPGHSE